MPEIPPPGGEVDWPAAEGTLGVVGVAPWATVDFCRALYSRVRASKDWHYPRVLLDVNTKIPSRGRHLQLGEADPSPAIAATIRELAAAGATVAVVVCNTAHVLYERWSKDSPIPVLDIVDETVAAAAATGARCIVPFVSASLASRNLYGVRARARGLRCERLGPEDQRFVEELIETVKVSGAFGASGEERLRELLGRLSVAGVDTVVGGCTELSGAAAPAAAAGVRFVDSNDALARAALLALRMHPERLRA